MVIIDWNESNKIHPPPRSYKEAWLSYKASRNTKLHKSTIECISLKVLRGLDTVRRRPGMYIGDAIDYVDKIFSVLNDSEDELASTLHSMKEKFQELQEINFWEFTRFLNNKLLTFTLKNALKLTMASEAISIFKKLKQVTETIIFSSTRNFSIQKNLSISA
ncbi:hypothetical protein [Acinetobacter sp. WCHAc060025]|uniref:hypothetical protein n=1 Tax=Acinetobacter sp. WCHAc060025 TaxID=2518625 RepID=UPI00102357A9|nr:hypothetical protein [Acinetobacter sp. WCHAc060025]RZG75325.1 hypothetical protein EXE09_10530 [Acinetobacter sp. WCHAc060025]